MLIRHPSSTPSAPGFSYHIYLNLFSIQCPRENRQLLINSVACHSFFNAHAHLQVPNDRLDGNTVTQCITALIIGSPPTLLDIDNNLGARLFWKTLSYSSSCWLTGRFVPPSICLFIAYTKQFRRLPSWEIMAHRLSDCLPSMTSIPL
jgi:hypothetical protein